MRVVAEKKRLPVLNASVPAKAAHGGEDDDDGPRPGWHWAGFGAVAIFAAWLPLAYVAQWLVLRVVLARYGIERAGPDELRVMVETMAPEQRSRWMLSLFLPHAAALALASLAGGALVGRFGKGAGPREAAVAGLLATLVAAALACTAGGASAVPLVTAALTVPFAALGARLTRRRD